MPNLDPSAERGMTIDKASEEVTFAQNVTSNKKFIGETGVTAGKTGTAGVLEALDDGTDKAGYLKMSSEDGTVWYMFFENDGTLKRHTAAPALDGDGTEVGAQT